MNIFKTKKLFAFGLAEILVGLAITGGVLIAITSVSIGAYKQIQDNELGDQANSIMLMSIEYLKTPISDITKEPALTLNKYFVSAVTKVAFSINSTVASQFSLTKVTENDFTDITQCSDASSNYLVPFSSTTVKKPVICNKVVVEKLSTGGFLITSSIAYKTFNGTIVTSKIVGFRQYI